jgi:hypothetical protein
MKKQIKSIGALLVLVGMMTGCASTSLKAPCDHHATFCGTKTKINRW